MIAWFPTRHTRASLAGRAVCLYLVRRAWRPRGAAWGAGMAHALATFALTQFTWHGYGAIQHAMDVLRW